MAFPREVLRELFRISAPKGRLIISVPNGDRFRINEVIRNKVAWQPADDIFYTFSELNLLLRDAGWRLRSVETIGPLFPRIKRYTLLVKIMLRITEKTINYFNLAPLSKKTTVITAEKCNYLGYGEII